MAVIVQFPTTEQFASNK